HHPHPVPRPRQGGRHLVDDPLGVGGEQDLGHGPKVPGPAGSIHGSLAREQQCSTSTSTSTPAPRCAAPSGSSTPSPSASSAKRWPSSRRRRACSSTS